MGEIKARIMSYYLRKRQYNNATFYWIRTTHVTLAKVSSDYIFLQFDEDHAKDSGT